MMMLSAGGHSPGDLDDGHVSHSHHSHSDLHNGSVGMGMGMGNNVGMGMGMVGSVSSVVSGYGSVSMSAGGDGLGDPSPYDLLLSDGDMEQLSLEIEKERLGGVFVLNFKILNFFVNSNFVMFVNLNFVMFVNLNF